MRAKIPGRTMFGVSLPTPLVEWVDSTKEFDTRSHFIATSLFWYRKFLEDNNSGKKIQQDIEQKQSLASSVALLNATFAGALDATGDSEKSE